MMMMTMMGWQVAMQDLQRANAQLQSQHEAASANCGSSSRSSRTRFAQVFPIHAKIFMLGLGPNSHLLLTF